jgi:hypothetical protein
MGFTSYFTVIPTLEQRSHKFGKATATQLLKHLGSQTDGQGDIFSLDGNCAISCGFLFGHGWILTD